MDLQQQQTNIVKTGNPQAITQPSLAASSANLQQNAITNVNQLSVSSLPVNAACTTKCSGSIPAPITATKNSSISGATWVIMAVGIVVVAIVAWMFRRLSSSSS